MIAINIDGKIKTFSEYPKTWNNISPYQFADSLTHYEDGFRDFVTPVLTAGQKLGAIVYDAVNDVFTYSKADKSAEELANETANAKEQEKEKIKQKYLDRVVEDSLIPADALKYYKEWEQRAYANKEGAIFKSKPFRNTVEGNINAPDKGGWIEIK